MIASPPLRQRSYNSAAWFYERAADFYSGGLIAAAKRWQIAALKPGDRALYAGVGTGDDALWAARTGVALTCIDVAPKMLARTSARLDRFGLSAELICDDIRRHQRPGYYDVVTANFFLNIFEEPAMVEMLAHLAGLVRPGGKLLIADVAPAQGGVLARTLHQLHYQLGMTFFWLLGLAPRHPIYDYRQYFGPLGLTLASERLFRLGPRGPVSFAAWTAVRQPE
jgi:ubiquinone/menaquinone biosynthesis C-methylase UbiE